MTITHLTPGELADRWKRSRATLACWRSRGSGPAYLKVGRSVLYALEDVEAYESARKIQPIAVTQA